MLPRYLKTSPIPSGAPLDLMREVNGGAHGEHSGHEALVVVAGRMFDEPDAAASRARSLPSLDVRCWGRAICSSVAESAGSPSAD
jgi:hypothetical protein